MLRVLEQPFKAIGRNSDVVRLLRTTGIYTPLRLLHARLSKEELNHWKELREFRARYAAILNGAHGALGHGGRALFVTFQAGTQLALTEGMLAKALAMHGCRPLFVTTRHNQWTEEYLRAFGHSDFVYIEDYYPDRLEHEAIATAMLAQCRNQFDLANLEFRGVTVGQHVASRMLMMAKRGSIDPEDVSMRKEWLVWLTKSLMTVVAAERIMVTHRPDKLFVYSRYTPWGEFFKVALEFGVDTVHWYWGHLDDTLIFRRYRSHDRDEHFFSLSDEGWEEVKQMPWSHAQGEALKESLRAGYLSGVWFKRKNMLQGKKVKTPEQIRAELQLDANKKTAFVFSHVLWDATFWYGKSLFPDYGTWLIETIRRAIANPNVNWVVKMHPDNVWKIGKNYEVERFEEYLLIKRHFPELPEHVRLMLPENDTNTVSLFDFADYALTVRGTVGLEFPCFGVPVLTAGTGRYSGRGFTYDSGSVEEYFEKMDRIQDIPRLDAEMVALAQRFAYAVFNLRPFHVTSFSWRRIRTISNEYLSASDFVLSARSADELKMAKDLRQFADWVLHSTQPDFMSSQ